MLIFTSEKKVIVYDLVDFSHLNDYRHFSLVLTLSNEGISYFSLYICLYSLVPEKSTTITWVSVVDDVWYNTDIKYVKVF